MYYYEVLVSSQRYHGSKPLTYSSKQLLGRGTVVTVSLQHQSVLGLIVGVVPKPSFKTKPIDSVIADSALPLELLSLFEWMKDYYPGPLGQSISLFVPASIAGSTNAGLANKKPEAVKKSSPLLPPLTREQLEAMEAIEHNPASTFLLHGDTGTGKTRIYLELARKALGEKKSVIILTPEIGLTPQLVKTFKDSFDTVYLLHSNLTPAQRKQTWLAIATSTEPVVVIGPRSAIFSPVHSVGLIVVDEAHDPAYKQEQTPYYQATRVASRLGQLHNAIVVLGSATPLVTDYYAFKSKGLPIIRMKQQAIQAVHVSKSQLINLRDKEQFQKSHWLSDALLKAISRNLERKRQALLFLNRRGTARLVLCQACGWQALCPRCNLPLTYHGDMHALICHTCGHNEAALSSCPVCKATDLVFRSIGTKSLEIELQHIFPKARIGRFDSDNKKHERLEAQYEAVQKGEIDILVGTQMLGKGLDLPKLGLLGVVVADTSLYFPDYTAEERTYQMLTQAMGRVNRGHTPGTAIIQTYHPNNTVIQAALIKDYSTFYEQQITQRREFGFPPFVYTLRLHCSRASIASARKAAEDLAASLRAHIDGIKLIGPSPAFVEKKAGKYHWQLVVNSKQRSTLTTIVKSLPSGWKYDIDPSHLL